MRKVWIVEWRKKDSEADWHEIWTMIGPPEPMEVGTYAPWLFRREEFETEQDADDFIWLMQQWLITPPDDPTCRGKAEREFRTRLVEVNDHV